MGCATTTRSAGRWPSIAPEIAASLEAPIEDLAAPAETLLATRCELHRVTGKSTNVLLLQDQDAVADAMGFADADVLMARVAEAARAIEWASERFWWRVDRAASKGQGARRPTRVMAISSDPGVTVVDDEVRGRSSTQAASTSRWSCVSPPRRLTPATRSAAARCWRCRPRS